MKNSKICASLVGVLVVLLVCSNVNAEKEKGVELQSKKEKISYLIGADIAQSIIPMKEDIDIDKLIMGMNDQYQGRPLIIPPEEGQTIMREFSMEMQKKMMEKSKELLEKNEMEGNSFLKENKEVDGVITTESGLQYSIIKEGTGPKPTATDKVKVNYRGSLIDGTEFDSSYKRGQPAEFPVNGVIKGWTEALMLMNVGSHYKLFIPSQLAYGQRGSPPVIGPSAVLVFEVELLEIKK